MWAGTINMHAGDRLLGVEYDAEATGDAIRQRCVAWLDGSGRDLPAVLGVRTAAVGLLRRRVGLLHHGASVRHHTPDLDSAVEALAAILAGIEAHPAPGEVHVETLVLTRDGRAVLLVLPAKVDVDHMIRKLGIQNVPSWRAVVDTATGEVLTDSRRLPIAAMVIADPMAGSSLDDSRRHLWALGDGDLTGWAELLEQRGDLIVRVPEDDAVGAVAAALP